MSNTSAADSRGTITQHGNVMRVQNALVEEVVTNNRTSGFIVISHAVRGGNNLIHIELLRLNVGRDTIIINQFGERACLCDIRKGMFIDAEFSAAMTRSIPPQSNAFRIVIRQNETSTSVTTDRVAKVDVNNSFLITGNPANPAHQMRFVISDATVILDQRGRPIRLGSIRPGQMVRVEHANFQTPSIPPQTTAFRVQLL
jgi:hypothetical protein